MKASLVADTSAWIAYFAGAGCLLLEQALLAGNVEIPALVKLELLGNSLDDQTRHALEAALSSIPVVSADSSQCERAGRLKAKLLDEGYAISVRDAHVLQSALDRGGMLLSDDPLFVDVQNSAGLKVQM